MFNLTKLVNLFKQIPTKLIWGLGALIAILLVFQAGKHSADSELQLINDASATNQSQQDIPDIKFHLVEAGQVSAPTVIGGSVIPSRSVTLTAQVGGQVQFLAGREGDSFNAGQTLVAINADDLVARRQAALAQAQNAWSAMNNAQVQYQREIISPQSRSISNSRGMGMPMMFDQMFGRTFSNFMPDNIGGDTVVDRNADLYNASTHFQQARGRYFQAKSQIDEIDARIADSRINSPFPGIILNKMVEQGDIVQPGMPLMYFADLSLLQLEAKVPTSMVSRLAPNMIVPVRLGGSDTETNARIEQIFPTADRQRRTVTVKFELPRESGAIPGMYAEVMLPGGQNDQGAMPVIPLALISFNGSLPTVRILDEQNRPQLRMIRIGERMADDQVAVISGLRVGERIIE